MTQALNHLELEKGDSGPRELVVTEGAGTAETAEVFRLAEVIDVVAQEVAPPATLNRPHSSSGPSCWVSRCRWCGTCGRLDGWNRRD